MPNSNLTLVTVILDRSGSMSGLREATVAGLNSFLDIQRKDPGQVLLHMVQFNNFTEVVRDFVPLEVVKPMTAADFVPYGGTALLDAMGRTIQEVGRRLAAMPEATRPGKVVVVIQTDGEENASREYNFNRIKDMVTHQREKYNWEFVFMGANIDAFSLGDSLGVLRGATIQYTSDVGNTERLYAVASNSINSYKRGVVRGDSLFSAQDRAEVVKTEDTGKVDTTDVLVIKGISTP